MAKKITAKSTPKSVPKSKKGLGIFYKNDNGQTIEITDAKQLNEVIRSKGYTSQLPMFFD